jgi:short coiled-coil protein
MMSLSSSTSDSSDSEHGFPPMSGPVAALQEAEVEIVEEPLERCQSPRRDTVTIEQIGREKVHVLRKEAQIMQESLTEILDRIAKVKEDYDRLSSENKFLQDYIGNLMATSNILNKGGH